MLNERELALRDKIEKANRKIDEDFNPRWCFEDFLDAMCQNEYGMNSWEAENKIPEEKFDQLRERCADKLLNEYGLSGLCDAVMEDVAERILYTF